MATRRPARDVLAGGLLLVLLAAAAAPPAAAASDAAACPTLPPNQPPPQRTFKLVAGKLPNSKTQTLGYNGSTVGPLIRVKLGERVRVDVANADIPEGTSVHWHGLDVPAWADGVAGVSQAPIPVGKTFTYAFEAKPAGTFWYHSHTGEQYGDGLRGPLIVDDPNDPHRSLYDYDLDDHVIMLADVFPGETVAQQLEALQKGGMAMPGGGSEAVGGGMAGGMAGGGAKAGGGMAGGGMAGSGAKAMAPEPKATAKAPEASAAPAGGGGMAGLGGMGAAKEAAGPEPAPTSSSMAGMAGMEGPKAAPASAGGMAGMEAPKAAPAPAHGAAKPAAAPKPGGSMASMAGPAAATAAFPTTCPPDVLDQDISDAPWGGLQANGKGGPLGAAPLVITVTKGKRYRLRVIGGMSSWAVRFGVAGHGLSIIALDGRAVTPKPAKSFVISSGERVDAVLAADQPVGNYWVDLLTLTGINSPAILHYAGAPDPMADAAFMRTKRASWGCAAGVGGQAGVVDLKNATFTVAAGASAAALGAGPIPQTADKTFVVYLADAAAPPPPAAVLKPVLAAAAGPAAAKAASVRGFAPAASGRCPPLADGSPTNYCWTLNWNAFEAPKEPAIFPGSTPARATYTLDVTQGDVVDIIMINPSRMVHPQHLHGTGFRLLAAGNGAPLAPGGRGLAPGVKLDLHAAPVRDTVAVPQSVGEGPGGFGYAVIRFRADAPGPWAWHCHIDLHAASGMFSVVAIHPRAGAAPWLAPRGAACGGAP